MGVFATGRRLYDTTRDKPCMKVICIHAIQVCKKVTTITRPHAGYQLLYVYKLSGADASVSVRGRSADGRDGLAEDRSPVGTTVALSPSALSVAPGSAMSIRCIIADRPGGASPLRNVSFIGVCTSKMDDC